MNATRSLLHDALDGVALTLARRLAHGGTVWCVSPAWSQHADRLADGLVAPTGAATGDASALPAGGLVGRLRGLARPGDVVVALADGRDPEVADLTRRAPAWGLTSVWIADGERPAPGSAHHLVWLGEVSPGLGPSGEERLSAVCRRVTELTRGCLERAADLPTDVDEGEVCVTCADEARIAEVVETHAGRDTATVRLGGRILEVDTSLIDPPRADDLVLVHAGSVLHNLGDGAAEGRTP